MKSKNGKSETFYLDFTERGKSMKIVVCDDDMVFCGWMERVLLCYGRLHSCKIEVVRCYSEEKLLQKLEEKTVDMLFLNTSVNNVCGIEIGSKIRKTSYGKKLKITYISSHQEQAMEIIRLHPFDFLVKPFGENEVYRVMDELREIIKEQRNAFECTDKTGYRKIPYDQILYFYSLGKMVHVITRDEEIMFRGQLRKVAEETDGHFLLIHKSFLVNSDHITHYRYDAVVMENRVSLSISKSHRKEVREQLLSGKRKITG